MKKPSWQHICEVLRVRHAPPLPMPADEFWRRVGPFLHADTAASGPAALLPLPLWGGRKRWAFAVAAALLFSAAVVVLEWRRLPQPGKKLAGISALEQVEVWVDYQSIMVVNSARHPGTVVWVSGMSAQSEPN